MKFTDVAAGTHHTCGVQANGYVVCWGHDGEKESSGYPAAERFTQVTCTQHFLIVPETIRPSLL